MDYAIEEGFDKGVRKGMKEGMKKGINEERLRIAKSMKEMDMEARQIAQATGLTMDEVARL